MECFGNIKEMVSLFHNSLLVYTLFGDIFWRSTHRKTYHQLYRSLPRAAGLASSAWPDLVPWPGHSIPPKNPCVWAGLAGSRRSESSSVESMEWLNHPDGDGVGGEEPVDSGLASSGYSRSLDQRVAREEERLENGKNRKLLCELNCFKVKGDDGRNEHAVCCLRLP
ncbi:hypothetical protein BSL78_13829 [Apostichopus japonicus]|uniref:Uncharacterized protein n=1 Tax=Stichopus japonicus TaxID=307972 RepID=A0A2G8KMR4_STIJA|nr:hypothetical protein BSL78_13829 [Apostichopus japonicus]